uniref:uroporphyrinogen-III C-methyltransferase n=1 Tax=Bosea sp. (in: a-proteobacteria) TaxID=1871050 RepID=UPI0033413A07
GPGAPELLTLKAIRALQSADIILYDDLVSPGVLEFARREAKRMLVGKTGYGPSVKQGEINALIVSLALQGKHVVRLKGGDPGIFGRAGEEIEACRAANIPVAIVPGISAAQGAAASLGLSLTHRDHARRLQFVTGHSRKGELPDDLDWRAMADPAASTVIYMARATLPGFRAKALSAGLDPLTPAVAVLSATRPDEMRIAATIATLPERLAELSQPGPVLVLLGHAFGAALVAAQTAAGRRRARGRSEQESGRISKDKCGGAACSLRHQIFGTGSLPCPIVAISGFQYVSFVIQNVAERPCGCFARIATEP